MRTKNTINVAIKSLLDFCVAGLCLWAFGFALMFGASAGGWIGTDHWLFAFAPTAGSNPADSHGQAFFIFQLMFCATSATIVSGAVAEHGASTEIVDLLSEMGRHRARGDFTQSVKFDPLTEVGQIAAEYNRVIAKVVDEMDQPEGIARRLREERENAEDIHRRVVSSIEYARRIQRAILPLPEVLNATFGSHALVYLPRDLVSGDFLWCYSGGGSRFLAVVDCTGHGVPGAFMSLIGQSVLQGIVAEQGIAEPALILSRMHQQVRTALRQDEPGAESHDGMDVCLVRLDRDQIVFAGARRPLWWTAPAPAGRIEPVFGEIKGNRASLGGGPHEKRSLVFDQHTLPITPGLRLHLASDGFADQPNHLRRPFDLPRLRALFRNTAPLPVEDRGACTRAALDAHRGGAAQRDDITLLTLAL